MLQGSRRAAVLYHAVTIGRRAIGELCVSLTVCVVHVPFFCPNTPYYEPDLAEYCE